MSKLYNKIYLHKNFKQSNQKRNKDCLKIKPEIIKALPPIEYYYDDPFHFGVIKNMDVSVVYEDGTEGEFELDFCCASCAQDKWRWSMNIFDKVLINAQRNIAIKIPNHITTQQELISYLRNT